MLLPNRFEAGILVLASLKSCKSLALIILNQLDLLQIHLDVEEVVSGDWEPMIHARKWFQRFEVVQSRSGSPDTRGI